MTPLLVIPFDSPDATLETAGGKGLNLARLARGEGLPAESAEPLYVRNKVALKVCER